MRDFSLEYVASYSSSTLSLPYTIAALWGGQAGSLLFWVLILTTMSTVVHLQNRERNAALMPYVTATLMTIAVFFLSLLVFITDPFERLPVPASEGADLNPLLQNYWMMIHPPSLYLGYVGCSVPFAFAIAALASGRLGDVWIRTTRRWTLFAWFFLTVGNMLGARWAYEELGWGGYWAWDPVENAAFMPWLSCTAFLHSVMIQEKKNMLKMWNMVLVLLTFCLTIFGTFLTRSGVVSSVHSFTQSGLGPFFVAFLLAIIAIVTALVIWRRPLLRSENEIDSFLSREAAFLFNNLLLVGIAFATFWGTIFPVISEAVRGIKITVGPPFFNKVNAPARPRAALHDRRRAGDRMAARQRPQPAAQLHRAARARLRDRCRRLRGGLAQLLRRRVLLARDVRARDDLHGVLSRVRAPARRSWASRRRERSPTWSARIAAATAAT